MPTYLGLPAAATIEYTGGGEAMISSEDGYGIYSHTTSPEGVIYAYEGSICMTPGALYYKSNGCGSTGWVEVT